MLKTIAVCILITSIAGCSSDIDSVPPTFAERACETVDRCTEIVLTLSYDECVKKFERDFESDSEDCKDCFAGLTCSGWLAMTDDPYIFCDICTVCICEVP